MGSYLMGSYLRARAERQRSERSDVAPLRFKRSDWGAERHRSALRAKRSAERRRSGRSAIAPLRFGKRSDFERSAIARRSGSNGARSDGARGGAPSLRSDSANGAERQRSDGATALGTERSERSERWSLRSETERSERSERSLRSENGAIGAMSDGRSALFAGGFEGLRNTLPQCSGHRGQCRPCGRQDTDRVLLISEELVRDDIVSFEVLFLYLVFVLGFCFQVFVLVYCLFERPQIALWAGL